MNGGRRAPRRGVHPLRGQPRRGGEVHGRRGGAPRRLGEHSREAAAAAEVSDIADLLDTPDALTDDEIINADDLFLDNDFGASADFGTGLDIGSLTEQDSLEFDANSQNSLGLSNGDLQPNDEVNVISIEPLPAN